MLLVARRLGVVGGEVSRASSRSFIILVAVAFAVGGYAYFVDSKKDLTDTSTKKAKVFATASGKIEEIEVRSAAGAVTKLKKSGEAWQIIAPEAADADSSEVSSLVTTIESSKSSAPSTSIRHRQPRSGSVRPESACRSRYPVMRRRIS